MTNKVAITEDIKKELLAIALYIGISKPFARSFANNVLKQESMTLKQYHTYIKLKSQLIAMFNPSRHGNGDDLCPDMRYDTSDYH